MGLIPIHAIVRAEWFPLGWDRGVVYPSMIARQTLLNEPRDSVAGRPRQGIALCSPFAEERRGAAAGAEPVRVRVAQGFPTVAPFFLRFWGTCS